MTNPSPYISALLANLRAVRERAGLSEAELEERLILGPGWTERFESGQSMPSLDMLLAILHETGGRFDELLEGVPDVDASDIERVIYTEADGDNLTIHFRYAKYDAQYTLPRSSVEEFEHVIKTLRDGLARLNEVDQAQTEAIKTDSVAQTFLEAVTLWPHASPSDIWWFIVYRAYCDPFNHPAQYARLDFTQSWKRTGGWALEEILVRHYGSFLKTGGINIYIADSAEKEQIVENLNIDDRIEADKIDIVLTGDTPEGPVFFGVVHVKASFAERRTDDVPMSISLRRAGFTSPLWTMDCKSTPGTHPVNQGELGAADGHRSAKRKDIEDEGYFTGCFSYNKATNESLDTFPDDQRIYVCDFSDPNDLFSQFIVTRWQEFRDRD